MDQKSRTFENVMSVKSTNLPAVNFAGYRDIAIMKNKSEAVFPGKLYQSIIWYIEPTRAH